MHTWALLVGLIFLKFLWSLPKNVKITHSASIFRFFCIFLWRKWEVNTIQQCTLLGKTSQKRKQVCCMTLHLTWIFQGTSFRMWQLTECNCFGCDTFLYNNSHLQRERFMKPIFIIVISNFDIVVYTLILKMLFGLKQSTIMLNLN